MNTIKCLVVDDEPFALQQLASYVSKVPFLKLVDQCLSADAARKVIDSENYAVLVDLLYLLQIDDVRTMYAHKLDGWQTLLYALHAEQHDDFDETIDDFALASIALSLKAISLNPSLLDEYGAYDRLLFSAADYLDLSKSKTMTALQGLLADEETKILLSMFLLASAKKNLSMCSFRLFGVEKPKEEVWSTKVTEEDRKNVVEDEFGVEYSKDWKRLLKARICKSRQAFHLQMRISLSAP